jgi:hypothetical protein
MIGALTGKSLVVLGQLRTELTDQDPLLLTTSVDESCFLPVSDALVSACASSVLF